MPILILNWNPYLNRPLILSEERFPGTLLQAVYSKFFVTVSGATTNNLLYLESNPILRSRMNEQLPYFVFQQRLCHNGLSKKTSVSMNLRAAMSLLVWWSHESAATGAKLLMLYRERTAEDTQPLWREEAAPPIYELALQPASLNSPQDTTHSSDSQTPTYHNARRAQRSLRFGPTSPETPIPSLLERLARLKRKRRSSSSESSDYDNLDDETEEEEDSQSSAEVQNQPRLFIRIPKRRTDTAKDDNSNGGNEVKQEEDSQNLAEEAQAVPGQPRLLIGVQLPKRETDTVKDDNSSDICHVQITRPATPLSETNTFAPTTVLFTSSVTTTSTIAPDSSLPDTTLTETTEETTNSDSWTDDEVQNPAIVSSQHQLREFALAGMRREFDIWRWINEVEDPEDPVHNCVQYIYMSTPSSNGCHRNLHHCSKHSNSPSQSILPSL